MNENTIDIDFLKTWESRTETLEDDITLFPAKALSAALDNPNTPNKGDKLPAFWEWMYFLATPKASETGADGHPAKGGFLPPVPLPRRMWAAGKQQRLSDIIIGEPAKRISTIKSVELKTGSTGQLVFVTVGHEIYQNDTLCLQQDQNIVYREAAGPNAPLPPAKEPPADAQFESIITPDPVLLYRFSALTYNGHRIHYDRTYAMNEEHYPALVVHGPLLVTLLLELQRNKLPDAQIKDFKFRAVRPTFDTTPFKVQGKLDGKSLSLWSVDDEGALCMQIDGNIA